jgi:hypothetical protein
MTNWKGPACRAFFIENAAMNDRSADAARWRATLSTNPNDKLAWHNLASAEGDLGHADESEKAARKAIALGLAAPETRLVLARALQAQRRLDEAEKTSTRRSRFGPPTPSASRLAQLVWMRTARADLALARIDRALRASHRDASLYLIRSIVLEVAGDRDAAFAAAVTGLTPRRATCRCSCTRRTSPPRWTGRAARAPVRAPGRPARADRCRRGCSASAKPCSPRASSRKPSASPPCCARRLPRNQYAIALQATAWRCSAIRATKALHYDTMVVSRKLPIPSGWRASRRSSTPCTPSKAIPCSSRYVGAASFP